MATTTNYGWTTPDDTALVKDGAAAIRTLGSSVDTTTKNLNPETTLGDLAYRSSTANVKTRLGLGTAGQILAVNSGANAPEWVTPASGGMTLISTTTLTGATTTVGSIPGTYNSLFGLVYGVTNATANGYMKMQANAADNATSTATEGTVVGGDATRVFLNPNTTLLRTDANNVFSFTIDNYASATNYKSVYWTGVFVNSSSVNAAVVGGGGFRTNTAITSLVFNNSQGNLSTGTVLLYGVK